MLCHNGMLQPKKISSRGLWEGESEGWGAGGALQLTIRLSHLLYAMTRFFRSLHICTLNVVQCNPMNTSLERFATLDFQRGQTVRALRLLQCYLMLTMPEIHTRGAFITQKHIITLQNASKTETTALYC